MAELTNNKPVLLIKKLGAMILLIAGALLAASGYAGGPGWLGVAGVILLAIGVVLLILKIVRRNEVGA